MTQGSHASQPEMSYVAASASQPVLEHTLGDALRLAARTWPSKLALIEGSAGASERRKWTFQELLAQSEQVSRALLFRFRPGDHIAIWVANQPEWVLVEFGAALAGLTLVTVNPAFLDEELIFVLKQSKARGIVVQDVFRDRNLATVVERVRSAVPSLESIIPLSSWRDFLRSGEADSPLPDVRPNDVVQIQYTSGTTGIPKGARLTHRNLTNNSRIYARTIGAVPNDIWVNPMPMFHTAGCGLATLGALQTGAPKCCRPASIPNSCYASSKKSAARSCCLYRRCSFECSNMLRSEIAMFHHGG